jgi:hypothetical protein
VFAKTAGRRQGRLKIKKCFYLEARIVAAAVIPLPYCGQGCRRVRLRKLNRSKISLSRQWLLRQIFETTFKN